MQKKTKEIESNSDAEESLDEEMDTNEQESASDGEMEAGPSGSGVTEEKSAKKKKRGIIYISTIPKYMNVTILREMLGQYAKIGRVFLQPGKLTGK